MSGDLAVARDVFDMCKFMALDLKDVKDVNITMPLMILAHNSFSFAEAEEALFLARELIATGIRACEDSNATDSEVSLNYYYRELD